MSLCPRFHVNDPALDQWWRRHSASASSPGRGQKRRPIVDPKVTERVEEILRRVEGEGADAVRALVEELDGAQLSDLFVTDQERENLGLPEEDMDALRLAADQVRAFHEEQLAVLTEGWTALGDDTRDGWAWKTDITEEEPLPDGLLELAARVAKRQGPQISGAVGQRLLPVDAAGVYAPGGKASYPSSVIMNAVPARVAGVEQVALASPPGKDGRLPTALLAAADLAEVDVILKAGGAVAVAAFAFGIEGLPPVDVVVGPGNAYVNEAKRLLWGTVGTDSYAASSEVAIMAFPDAPVTYAAADWLTQVEHSEDNVGVLFTTEASYADEVLAEVERQLTGAPNEGRMRAALRDFGAVIVGDEEAIFAAMNRMAPEHVSVLTQEPGPYLAKIRHAGCIVMGLDSPQAAGDFIAGPSHTLPTAGGARFASPLNVMHFLRFQSVIRMERFDLERLGPAAERMAALEGFPAHGAGFRVRLKASISSEGE